MSADGAFVAPITVLVADDQEIVRTGLAMILDAQPGIEVVAQAADGRTAVELARRLRPDVSLLDIRMPGLDGIEATALLAGREVADPLAVVVITTFDLDEYVYAALRAGARGFLLKDAGAALLSQAVRAAAAGDALIAPSVTTRLLRAFADSAPTSGAGGAGGSGGSGVGKAGSDGGVPQPLDPLTAREEEVLLAVARGRTNNEIARELFVTLSTVKSHVANLMTKVGARNRVEVALWAYDTGRVRPGQP
ncbi:response regulator transcription factor [Promicromonospora sukumoe]|uniref:response regulator transcription factor n=1 Tax=Promicromonospora sukumoe TaxID=88382 RepID=UPI000369242A|nr:response regulator transcription factor [Promicromonospora sukumoe]